MDELDSMEPTGAKLPDNFDEMMKKYMKDKEMEEERTVAVMRKKEKDPKPVTFRPFRHNSKRQNKWNVPRKKKWSTPTKRF